MTQGGEHARSQVKHQDLMLPELADLKESNNPCWNSANLLQDLQTKGDTSNSDNGSVADKTRGMYVGLTLHLPKDKLQELLKYYSLDCKYLPATALKLII